MRTNRKPSGVCHFPWPSNDYLTEVHHTRTSNDMTQKIIPNLWLDGRAEEAATFYTSLLDGSRITNVMRFHVVGSEIHGQAPRSVSTVDFAIPGFRRVVLNGSPL